MRPVLVILPAMLATDENNLVVSDSELFAKIIKESLIVMGYRGVESFAEVVKAGERCWVIDLRFRVER